MNIEEYIASGILESYVLGELTPAEVREVEANVSKYPEIREALTKVEETQELLLSHNAFEPRPELKKRILEGLEIKQRASRGSKIWILNHTTVPRLSIAASVSLIILVSFLAFWYYSRLRNAELELLTLKEERTRLVDSVDHLNLQLTKSRQSFEILTTRDFIQVELAGTPNSPNSRASVYWNPTTSEVFLISNNLDQLVKDKQYQLWAIVNGVPVDAGVFDTSSELIKMKSVSGNVAAFAITIEDRGGSVIPSLITMKVIGNV